MTTKNIKRKKKTIIKITELSSRQRSAVNEYIHQQFITLVIYLRLFVCLHVDYNRISLLLMAIETLFHI